MQSAGATKSDEADHSGGGASGAGSGEGQRMADNLVDPDAGSNSDTIDGDDGDDATDEGNVADHMDGGAGDNINDMGDCLHAAGSAADGGRDSCAEAAEVSCDIAAGDNVDDIMPAYAAGHYMDDGCTAGSGAGDDYGADVGSGKAAALSPELARLRAYALGCVTGFIAHGSCGVTEEPLPEIDWNDVAQMQAFAAGAAAVDGSCNVQEESSVEVFAAMIDERRRRKGASADVY